jgi:hypothetical protein
VADELTAEQSCAFLFFPDFLLLQSALRFNFVRSHAQKAASL